MAYDRKMAPFGTRIRELRLSRGMTQSQLAVAIGATQSAVSKWERGERQDISIWQALAIAKRIIELHESIIDVVSSTKKGTAFTFLLPEKKP